MPEPDALVACHVACQLKRPVNLLLFIVRNREQLHAQSSTVDVSEIDGNSALQSLLLVRV